MAISIKKIFLKKKLEGCRSAEDSNTNCMNTQQWNQYLCTTSQILLVVFVMLLFQGFLAELVKLFSLNSCEKSLLTTNVSQVLLSLGRALYMYGTNKSMRHHLKHEILGKICGCENLLPNMYPQSSYEMKNLPKTIQSILIMDPQSSSEIKKKSELTQRTEVSQVHTATMIKQRSILNQVEDGESTHDYLNQKNHLSIVRLKEAGFQLSNYTLEDGNCLIHALKDQMR